MARTQKQIFEALIAQKESNSNLSGLTSTSKAAIWRLLLWVTAAGIWIHEQLWEQKKQDLIEVAARIPFGTPPWYAEQALLYQHGDSLVWDGDRYGYATEDLDVRIVAKSAVSVDGSQVNIKAAKEDSSGDLIKLSAAEKSGLEGYFDKIKFVGTPLSVISEDPDDLKVEMVVYYDPLKMTAAGALVDDNSIFPVQDAIKNYIQGLDFGGVFREGELSQKILEVDGVTNVGIDGLWAKYGGLNYFEVNDFYQSFAGYMALDVVGSNITYRSS